MHTELRRLTSERQIVEAKRNEVFKACVQAEQQRTAMRLHFERQQAERDAQTKVNEAFRANQREHVINLGTEVQMLSTKCDNRNGMVGDATMDSQIKLSKLMREFTAVQKKLLMATQVKENLLERHAVQLGQGGVAGRVDNASKHLNMFTKDTSDDVAAMKLKLQQTMDRIMEQEKLEKKQESRIRELRGELANAERKIQNVSKVSDDLAVREKAAKQTDYAK